MQLTHGRLLAQELGTIFAALVAADGWRFRAEAVVSLNGSLWIRGKPMQRLNKLHLPGKPISRLILQTAESLLP